MYMDGNTHSSAGKIPGSGKTSPEWLKDQTQMLLVIEVSEQTNTVEFVVRVCIIQLLQELQLFKTCLLPTKT